MNIRKLEWCSSFLICELRNYVGQVRGTLQSPMGGDIPNTVNNLFYV